MILPQNRLPLPLHCHPATPVGVALAVSVAVSVTPTGLQLVYAVVGDCTELRIPHAVQPGPADGLWRHTCLEAFVAVEGEAAYREFNFSPSGQWAHYGFASERVRTSLHSGAAVQPSMGLQSSREQLTLTAHLPWSALPPRGAALCMGLSAVIEETNHHLSYWALHHPCEQADFHHPAGRSLRLALPTH